jgi:MFS superfamily sulfate permease-like transporter
MLAAIGLILIMKQLPHAVGYDADADSDLSFLEDDSHTTLSFLFSSLNAISFGATIVSCASLVILLIWESSWIKKKSYISYIPGSLIAVIFGLLYNALTKPYYPTFAIADQHLVSLPEIFGPVDFYHQIHFPSFSYLTDAHIYVTAAAFALIGSLETLLSLEAVDKLDPLKRTAPTSQELIAQGMGNFISGLIGGLPITAVIVRSSANINAGARTKLAAIFHGVLLLLSVMFCASI